MDSIPVPPRFPLWRGLIVTAAAYWGAGKLALLLAIPPGYATAIWPSAGLALACLLLFGARVWPGIVVGSFFVNFWTALDTTSAATLARSIALPASISVGAALQALIGAALVRRSAGSGSSLMVPAGLLRFLLMGGPVSCLLNATWGVTSLYLAGAIGGSQVLFNGWTWWVGDTIGVILFAPLALLWAPSSRQLRRRKWTVSFPLGLTFSSVVLLFVLASGWEMDRLRLEFEQSTQIVVQKFRRDFDGYLELVRSVESLHAATGKIDRDPFRSFVSPLLPRHPGMQAISWNRLVREAEREEFERSMRAQGFKEFRMIELDGQDRPVPASSRPEYVCVTYIEPHEKNRAALGYDVISHPARRTAFERARDSGKPTATRRITLIQDKEAYPAILVALPIYAEAGPRGSVDDRRRALRGYATGVFRIPDLLDPAFKGLNPKEVGIQLIDENAEDPDRLLFEHRGAASGKAPGGPEPILSRSAQFEIADRPWKLFFTATPDYLAARRSWQAWSVLAAGLLFAGLLGAFLLVVTGRASEVEELVVRRTGELQKANEDLQRMFSDRLQAEEAVRRSQARLAQAQEVAHIGSWEWDIATNTVTWSEELFRIFGVSPETFAPSYDNFLSLVHPEDREVTRQRIERSVRGRETLEYEYRTVSPTGGVKILHARGVLVLADDGTPLRIVGTAQDITERKETEEQIRASLREKEALLKEVHHRVKNNLQIVSSLLNLQSESIQNAEARALFRESQDRLRSIALIHETLYRNEALAGLDFDEYIQNLTTHLARSYGAAEAGIQLRASVESVRLGLDVAIPCGLIVTELVTNAFKYAFSKGSRGIVEIDVRRGGKGGVVLEVRDNGVGLPADFEIEKTDSLGLKLVAMLTRQLHGEMEFRRLDSGSAFTIRLSKGENTEESG